MTKNEMLKIAKPILFNTEMVRAIQDERKTVTRRIVKNNPCECTSKVVNGVCKLCDDKGGFYLPDDYVKARSPYKVGDILYVRETWFYEEHMHDITAGEPDLPSGRYSFRYVYKAEYPDYPVNVGVGAYGWQPSIHMPKEAARIFLRVTDVRVERLQNIDGYGILAEGVDNGNSNPTMEKRWENMQRMAYSELWNSTVKKSDLDKYGWSANPWVWVIEFERV